MRVWKARERGKLLERVKSLRAVKAAWATWQNSIAVQREREGWGLSPASYCYPDCGHYS